VRFHQEKRALATLALTHVANPTEYGVVVTNQAGRIQQYLEKPSRPSDVSDYVNTGIYLLEPKVLDDMKPNTTCDFSYDIFPQMLTQNQALFGYLAEGYWRDMGTMQSYQQCLDDIRAGKIDLMRDTTRGWIAMSEFAKLANESFGEPLVITNAALNPLREQKPALADTLQQKVPAVLLAQSFSN
jgi:NDP-sugar pyrophosphorylase family protein